MRYGMHVSTEPNSWNTRVQGLLLVEAEMSWKGVAVPSSRNFPIVSFRVGVSFQLSENLFAVVLER